jgi:hypothetical protein
MSTDWPLTDRLLYYTSRALERFTGGNARIVRYYFVAQRVPDAPLAAVRGPMRFYSSPIPQDVSIRQALRPEPVISHRFASGARCFTAVSGTELAGFIWIKEDEYLEDEVRCAYRWQPVATGSLGLRCLRRCAVSRHPGLRPPLGVHQPVSAGPRLPMDAEPHFGVQSRLDGGASANRPGVIGQCNFSRAGFPAVKLFHARAVCSLVMAPRSRAATDLRCPRFVDGVGRAAGPASQSLTR